MEIVQYEIQSEMKTKKNSNPHTAKGCDDEIIAAITMALHQELNEVHDYEDMRLTINNGKHIYSPWNSRINSMPEFPDLHKTQR